MHAPEQPRIGPAAGTSPHRGVSSDLNEFLTRLKESRLLRPWELSEFLSRRPGLGDADVPLFGRELVDRNLLNDYQLKRVVTGQTFGLVLGNYRILRFLAQGGMAIVYKAEHIYLKRAAAVKVIVIDTDEDDPVFLKRFTSEMEALARLRHPHIVLAFDAGEEPIPGEPGKVLHYLAMEYVPGQDLENHVLERGALPLRAACAYVRQAALGLHHAHEHGLVHRDIKPSNLLLTGRPAGASHSGGPTGRIKILDFGLARLYRRRCTEVRAMLGTVDYVAPEQARDPRIVDARADVFALGGTFYWLLTGRRPFGGDRSAVEEWCARPYETIPSARAVRPDVPRELEAILTRMMALDPEDRYPSLLPVLSALDEFLGGHAEGGTAPPHPCPVDDPPEDEEGEASALDSPAPSGQETQVDLPPATEIRRRVSGQILLLTARPACRDACRTALDRHNIRCQEVTRAEEVPPALAYLSPGVILIDEDFARHSRVALCRSLREATVAAPAQLVLLTDTASVGRDQEAESWCDERLAWDDGETLGGRVRLLLRLQEAEERAARLADHLLATSRQLEQSSRQCARTHRHGQELLIFALAQLAQLRGQESGAHLLRMQGYVRILAEEAARLPAFQDQIDDDFVSLLERCVLLHDIGKVALPDHVLLKPGRLDAEERLIMESHTILGADLLQAVSRRSGAGLTFLDVASDIVRYHHERHDGTGYPEGLSGAAIPLAARFVALADSYDAMRSRLVYKPALAHTAASRLLLSPDQGQFDPVLLEAFRNGQDGLAQVFDLYPD